MALPGTALPAQEVFTQHLIRAIEPENLSHADNSSTPRAVTACNCLLHMRLRCVERVLGNTPVTQTLPGENAAITEKQQ